MTGPLPEADRIRAAEYVLGVLDPDERRQARARIVADPAFATLVRLWERRLSPLHELAVPVSPPPALWRAIRADFDADATALPAPRAAPERELEAGGSGVRGGRLESTRREVPPGPAASEARPALRPQAPAGGKAGQPGSGAVDARPTVRPQSPAGGKAGSPGPAAFDAPPAPAGGMMRRLLGLSFLRPERPVGGGRPRRPHRAAAAGPALAPPPVPPGLRVPGGRSLSGAIQDAVAAGLLPPVASRGEPAPLAGRAAPPVRQTQVPAPPVRQAPASAPPRARPPPEPLVPPPAFMLLEPDLPAVATALAPVEEGTPVSLAPGAEGATIPLQPPVPLGRTDAAPAEQTGAQKEAAPQAPVPLAPAEAAGAPSPRALSPDVLPGSQPPDEPSASGLPLLDAPPRESLPHESSFQQPPFQAPSSEEPLSQDAPPGAGHMPGVAAEDTGLAISQARDTSVDAAPKGADDTVASLGFPAAAETVPLEGTPPGAEPGSGQAGSTASSGAGGTMEPPTPGAALDDRGTDAASLPPSVPPPDDPAAAGSSHSAVAMPSAELLATPASAPARAESIRSGAVDTEGDTAADLAPADGGGPQDASALRPEPLEAVPGAVVPQAAAVASEPGVGTDQVPQPIPTTAAPVAGDALSPPPAGSALAHDAPAEGPTAEPAVGKAEEGTPLPGWAVVVASGAVSALPEPSPPVPSAAVEAGAEPQPGALSRYGLLERFRTKWAPVRETRPINDLERFPDAMQRGSTRASIGPLPWRGLALGLLAATLVSASWIGYREWGWPRGGHWVAVLQQEPLPSVAVRFDPGSGVLFARAFAPAPAQDEVYRLWLLPAGGGARLMGAFSAGLALRSTDLGSLGRSKLGTAELLITLEPRERPSAAADGPVGERIYRGRLVPE